MKKIFAVISLILCTTAMGMNFSGCMIKNGEVEIDGSKYYYDSGNMLTGFQNVEGGTKYFNTDTGVMQTGWQQIDSASYYFDPVSGLMAKGFQTIDGSKYYFAEDGKRASGLIPLDEGTYFADPSTGVISSGVQTIDNKTYCFDKDTNTMQTGWVTLGEDTYYFDETTGEGISGIREIDGNRYGFIGGCVIRNERAMANNHLYYFDEKGVIYREIDGSKPLVAITYDDGPYDAVTNEILDVFLEYNQRCTFFIVGDRISDYESCIVREAENGFQQGNHTYAHKFLSKLDFEGQVEAIKQMDDELIRVTGKPASLFRYPGGYFPNSDDQYKDLMDYLGKGSDEGGKPVVNWSIDTLDWESKNADKVCGKVIGQVKDGDIVLMHDIYKSTGEATKRIVPALVDAGFQLVTIDELALLRTGKLPENGTVYFSIKSAST